MEIRNVSVRRGSETVFSNVSLSAERGELLGIVGPNGAGKTTLLRAINGTLDYEGRITVGGDEIAGMSARERSRRVATVPQETALSFDFTVREVVAMGRHPHTARFERHDADPVAAALERTDTARFADRPASAVSGGERKRVLVARALAQDAPLTLFDEPTGGLDVNHAVRALELAAELAAEGRAVVAAIHDLSLAARYCDRLVVLADGGVCASGTPPEVLTPETVRRAFDANAAVSRDPVTDSPLVTALPEASGERAGRGHVFGGGGAAVRFLYPLVSAGFDVSVGPVPEGDRDAEAADALGCETLTVPPFASPGPDDTTGTVDAADAVLLAPVEPAVADTLAGVVPRGKPTVALGEAWPMTADLPRNAAPESVIRAVATAVNGTDADGGNRGVPRPQD